MSLITPFTTLSRGRSALPYEGAYRQDYVTDLFILVLDETKRQVLEYQLVGAFPLTTGETNMSWQEQDAIVKVNVTFGYREWLQRSADSSLFNTISNLVSTADRVLNSSSRVPISLIDDIRALF